MDIQDNKTKEELLKELQELQYENNSLKALYDKDITNRKRTEDALWESENQLYSIYNTIGDVIFHLAVKAEEEYRFIYVNQVFYNVTGLSKEQVIGKMVNEVIPESSLTMVLGKYRQAINENSIIRWEETSDYPTGRLIGEVSILPVFDNKGNCTHLAGSVHDITGRKRAEETLKKLSNAVEQTADIVFITNRDGIIEYVNPAFEKLTGYTKQEAVGKTPRILKSGSYSQAQYEHTWKTILSGMMFKNVMLNKRKSGELFYTEQTITPVKDTQGSITHFVSTNRDITERKQAEDALRESELKFRNYIDYAPHGVFVTDEMGNYVDVNTAASSITGYSKDELLSMKLFELIPEESMEFSARHFEKVVRDGFATGEFPFIKKDRSIGYWSVEAVKLSDQRFLGFVVDVTKRKQAEEMLQESEERFRKIFEESQVGIIISALDYRFEKTNPAFCSMMGYTTNELISMTFVDITHPDDIGKDIENIKKLELGEIPFYVTEKKYLRKTGEILWGNIIISGIRNKDGTQLYYLGMIHDITERKRAELELIIANKELAFQNEEKGKRADELIVANKELAFQNREKEKRADELFLANKELLFQNEEKEKRAAELLVANKELAFQNEEKEKRAVELIIAKEHAEESDRLKSAFLTNMSHEI
ncbi:MAG: PAS domain S-box protein, partial [Thermoplasmata archaeon]|nr:PAS domain S-box protein [Thermoplasmata archaeon]